MLFKGEKGDPLHLLDIQRKLTINECTTFEYIIVLIPDFHEPYSPIIS